MEESDIRVLISVPTKDVIFAQTASWILEAVKRSTMLGYKIGVQYVYSPYPIEMQRNIQVMNFLEDNRFTHLFFLDSDCVPEPLTIEKLLDYDLDIVASVAPALIRGNHVFTAATVVPEGIDGNPDDKYFMHSVGADKAHGLQEVDAVGMTGVLVKREVFYNIPQPYFKMCYDETHTILMMGEDYFFCQQAKEAGYKIWADFDLRQQHLKVVPL